MITIKRTDKNDAELIIKEGTPHTTILLGIEMLIEALLEEVPTESIDDLLGELRRIYLRDNGNDFKQNEEE